MEAVKISRADEIQPHVMEQFHVALRRKGNSERTVANKHNAIKAFVLWVGLDKKVVGRAPRYEKKLPKV